MSAAYDVKASPGAKYPPPAGAPVGAVQSVLRQPAQPARMPPSTFEEPTLARIDLALRHVLPNVLARLATSYVGREFADRASDFLTLAMNGSHGERVARELEECFVASPFEGDHGAWVLDVTRIGSEPGRQAVRKLLANPGFVRLLHEHAAERGSRLLKVVWPAGGRSERNAWRMQADFRSLAATGEELQEMVWRIAELLQSPGERADDRMFRLRDWYMNIARELFAAVVFAKGDVTRGWMPHARIDVTAACSRLGDAIGMTAAVRAFDLLLADPVVMASLMWHARYPTWVVRSITVPVITWMEPPELGAEGKQAPF